MLVVHALVLGFTRSADAFSVDALLRSRQGVLPPEPAATYGWPIKLLCAVTAAGYFLSGFAKLAGPQGLGWAHGVAMREQVAVDALRKELLEGGAPRLAYTLYDQVWLFTLMGIGTYVLELGAPLFLFGRRSRRLWAVCTWGMHWGIFMIMGIKFRYQLAFIVFLPFFNVEWIAHGARSLLPAGARRTRTP